jgi:murein L,D-transpeptidase YafK
MPTSAIAKSSLALFLLLVLPSLNFSQATTTDRIIIEKSARTMKLMRHGEILKTYKVALSRVPVGAKERAGDHKVPKGITSSTPKFARVASISLCTSPTQTPRTASGRARKLGASPGGNIEIHGLNTTSSWVGSLQRKSTGLTAALL